MQQIQMWRCDWEKPVEGTSWIKDRKTHVGSLTVIYSERQVSMDWTGWFKNTEEIHLLWGTEHHHQRLHLYTWIFTKSNSAVTQTIDCYTSLHTRLETQNIRLRQKQDKRQSDTFHVLPASFYWSTRTWFLQLVGRLCFILHYMQSLCD